jgi:hypothetical protein
MYDPRSYFAFAEAAMIERLKKTESDLRADGKRIFAL